MRFILLAIINLYLVAFLGAREAPSVGFEQRIGQQIPLDTQFTNESGQIESLRTAINGKPAVIYFNYLKCPQLCSVVADATIDTLRQLQTSVGGDFTVLTISIDPTDDALAAKAWKDREVSRYGRTGSGIGWHMLTGASESINAATNATGYHFTFDARSGLYAHPAGIVIVTPHGVISQYFLGVDYPAKDVSSALVRASQNKIGETAFNLVLNCIEGALPGGKYGRLVWDVLSISVILTLLIVFGGIGRMLYQEFRGRRRTVL